MIEAPVGLGDHDEVRIAVAHGPDRVPPELASRGVTGRRRQGTTLPCVAEDVLEDQHRHVAAHPIAPRRHLEEEVDHGGPESRNAVVELSCVPPRREVWVAAVSEVVGPSVDAHREPAVGFRRCAVPVAMYVPVGMATDPGVVDRRVIRHEVEHQADTQARKLLSEPSQALFATDERTDLVGGDRIRGARDVVQREVGQDRACLRLQPRLAACDAACGRARPPDAHQPDEVRTRAYERFERLLGDVAELDPAPVGAGQTVQPRTRVELVDDGPMSLLDPERNFHVATRTVGRCSSSMRFASSAVHPV